jgi:hypothetical protein
LFVQLVTKILSYPIGKQSPNRQNSPNQRPLF